MWNEKPLSDEKKEKNIIKLFMFVFMVGAAIYMLSGLKDILIGSDHDAVNQAQQDIYSEIESEKLSVMSEMGQDAANQYEMAKQENDKLQMCYKATAASNAYIETTDKINYQKWNQIRKQDCSAVGVNDN